MRHGSAKTPGDRFLRTSARRLPTRRQARLHERRLNSSLRSRARDHVGGLLTRWKGSIYFRIMSLRKYLAGVSLAVSLSTASGAAQRTILKAMEACPNVKDFTDWFEATEKGDASRAADITDGKGCVEVNKGDVVEFERLLTNPFVVCVRPNGQSQCFWTSPFAISPQPQKP
jgi:hypothetical protein